jgi:tripartite-type tricarboxylate transporter receptor subunit TctC
MRKSIAILLATLAVAGAAHAQQWPTQPVKMIVNVAPGGVADRTARLLGTRLAEALGQPVVVENRPGGDGYIGFQALTQVPADGYTLLFTPGSNVMIAPHVGKRPDLDPLKTLVPIAPTVTITMYLEVHPSVPAKNVADFVSYTRANPGRVSYGSAGTGTALHIAAEVFKRETGADITHVPYKGAGPAMKDLLGGHLQAVFDPGIALEHVRAGRLRMLAHTAEQRSPGFPDVPTLAESGVRGVDGGPYFGFYGPAGVPAGVVQRMNREVAQMLKDPGLRKQLESTGLQIAPPMTPEAFAAYVRAESQRYAKLLPELGIRGE